MPNILNIAIPTFKRPDQLQECIASITQQIPPGSKDISITVYDDSLSSINDEVIKSAQSNFDQITCIKNSTNFGIDGNIENCLSHGNSDYVLVLGEDDILLPGAISNIIELINHSHPDIIYTSYIYINNKKNQAIRSPLSIFGKIAPLTFIEDYLWAIGFIGSTVIKRSHLLKNERRYLGTYFNHVGRIAINITSTTDIQASNMPLVGNRSDNLSSSTWSSSYYHVLFGFERLLAQLRQQSELSDSFAKSTHTLRQSFQYLKLHRVCVMRSFGIYDESIYDSYFSRLENLEARGLYRLVAKLPSTIFTPLRPLFDVARMIKRMTYRKKSFQPLLNENGSNS